MLNSINPQISSEEVVNWAIEQNESIEKFTDQDLIAEAPKADDNVLSNTDSVCEFVEESCKKIMHKEDIRSFSHIIQWAEENTISMQDVL